MGADLQSTFVPFNYCCRAKALYAFRMAVLDTIIKWRL